MTDCVSEICTISQQTSSSPIQRNALEKRSSDVDGQASVCSEMQPQQLINVTVHDAVLTSATLLIDHLQSSLTH